MQRQPRGRRHLCASRGQSRSSGTALGAPDRRDRRVATGVVSCKAVEIMKAVVREMRGFRISGLRRHAVEMLVPQRMQEP